MEKQQTFGEVLNQFERKQKSQSGTKYSFVGRPDYARIIRENEGADVIFVSREDGLVVALVHGAECDVPIHCTPIPMAQDAAGVTFEWFKVLPGPRQTELPSGWYGTTTVDNVQALRAIAQRIVRARNGKHTVEPLPTPPKGAQ